MPEVGRQQQGTLVEVVEAIIPLVDNITKSQWQKK